MTRLSDIMDINLLEEMITQKYVNRRYYEYGPLAILNYSDSCQYSKMWNDVTEQCRGLIYNTETEEIVARPFRKFFNIGERELSSLPSGEVWRASKMDGSLGVLYWNGTDYAIATRGSFVSEQAVKGTEMFHTLRTDWPLKEGKTYLWEIIFPENRIVVNYGLSERLVLLDVIDTATGKRDLAEFMMFEWPDKTETIRFASFSPAIIADIPSGEEGFVLWWPENDLRIKAKSDEYVELHRLVTGLNERVIWEQLGRGMSLQGICEPLPDELHGWVLQVGGDLIDRKESILREAYAAFEDTTAFLGYCDRGTFARHISASPYRPYLFAILDGKDFSEAVWKTLRPAGGRGPKALSEDVS